MASKSKEPLPLWMQIGFVVAIVVIWSITIWIIQTQQLTGKPCTLVWSSAIFLTIALEYIAASWQPTFRYRHRQTQKRRKDEASQAWFERMLMNRDGEDPAEQDVFEDPTPY